MTIAAEELRQAIHDVIQKERRKSYVPHKAKNERSYFCLVENCLNKGYAIGLCNAHYLRRRNNRTLETPLQCGKRIVKNCIDCEILLNGGGGWNLCASCYKTKRSRILKSILVEKMGGHCEFCKQKYPDCVFDFHHRDGREKKRTVSDTITQRSLIDIAAEASKCILLCSNCHRILTAKEKESTRRLSRGIQ